MRIALVEPYCTGSHAAWAKEYAAASRHQVDLYTLPGRSWKWRMHGGAVTLARKLLDRNQRPDLVLATDMLDLTTFLALARRELGDVPCAIYFHENQLTYPWSPGDPDPGIQRDLHYGFINYSSALAADAVLFNSRYHHDSFLAALPGFLRGFPDYQELDALPALAGKCAVLPLGLDLAKLDGHRCCSASAGAAPLILWNHRWEYDKNPEEFFAALYQLADQGVDFRLAVLGESFGRAPGIFRQARQRLAGRVVQWGYAESFADYAGWLWEADLLPVTSRQEFFGASVVQAMYCRCQALLPDRLAYPEHVPADQRQRWLYGEQDSLAERIRELLDSGSAANGQQEAFVARYDWQNLAPVYDSFFQSLVHAAPGSVPPVPAW
jgi:glycosyltransferase involved in cell wall biosynthesis